VPTDEIQVLAPSREFHLAVDCDEERYAAGSKRDFERLYQTTYQRVFRTLVAITGDMASAEDCAQEAYAKAFRAWDRWKDDAPAEAWVHRIAINTALSHRRRQRLREVGELLRRLGRPAQATGPEIVPDLAWELRRLPPKQAAVIVLRHLHGYTNREIAAALGVPESTIASRLAEAKRTLRARLMASRRESSDTSAGSRVPHSR
jgi:RNA polymerase sigma factor (sigma-70 family)